MIFSFDGDFAKDHGVDEAIMYNYFSYWIIKNKSNGKHFYDGYTWTYNSQKALSELFPFWNRSKIQRVIASLESKELLKKGNYNQIPYDRTTWYALPKFEQSLVQKQTNQCSNMNNVTFINEQPIPNNYQVTKQTTNNNINNIVGKDDNSSIPFEEIVNYLNFKTGSSYRFKTEKTQSLIKARFKEGFTLDDFKKVIDIKVHQWSKDKNMKSYLRPETLFGTKFESYLNEYLISNQNRRNNDIQIKTIRL